MLKKSLKSTMIFCLAIGVLLAGKKLYFSLTDGFSASNILPHEPYDKEWELRKQTASEKGAAAQALSQTYRYLEKGHQAYVFESHDKAFVLKFLKDRKYAINPWIASLPLPEPLDRIRSRNLHHKERKRKALFRSWKIAFDDLAEETGVIMVHIHDTGDLPKNLTITDKMGLSRQIDLNQCVFMVQRKADLLGPVLEKYQADGNLAGAQMILDRMLEMFVGEYQRGIEDKDHHVLRNTGILNQRPLHIDTGRFIKDDQLKRPEVYLKELGWRVGLFQEWLEKKYPELGRYFNERVEFLTAQQ